MVVKHLAESVRDARLLPPTAALFALPLTLVSFRTAVVAFSYLQVAIVLLTLVLVMPYTLPRSRWTLLVSAVIAAGFIGGDIGFGALKENRLRCSPRPTS
jgi:hypothetical protein